MTLRPTSGSKVPVQVVVDGQEVRYESRASAARAHGIKPATLHLRLKKGWTMEQALGIRPVPDNANTRTEIEVGGKPFPSISAAIRAFNVSASQANSRLKNGWTPEQIFGLSPPPHDPLNTRRIVVDGTTYESITVAADALGLNRATVYGRLQTGWSVEESFSITLHQRKPDPSKPITVIVDGKEHTFSSMTAAAEYFEVSPNTVLGRVSTYGWTLVKALTTKPKLTSITLRHNGKLHNYSSLSQAAAARGFAYSTVKQRIKKLGWTPEQAFELEPPPKHELGVLGYIYRVRNISTGKVYIGQTKTAVGTRWTQHIETALSTKKAKPGSLHHAINKEGPDNFTCQILEAAETIDQLNRLERKHIKQHRALDPVHGYNLARGGSGLTGGKKVRVEGKTFPSLSAAAREYGVEPAIAHQRIKMNGWTLQQALEIAPKPDGSSGPKGLIVKQGKRKHQFDSHKKAAEHFGIPYKKFMDRLSKAWTAEQALELMPRGRPAPERYSIEVEVDGQHRYHNSIKEAAEAFQLKPSNVQARLARGWSIEEALGIKSRKRKARSD